MDTLTNSEDQGLHLGTNNPQGQNYIINGFDSLHPSQYF